MVGGGHHSGVCPSLRWCRQRWSSQSIVDLFALDAARHPNVKTSFELVGPRSRAKLVVLAGPGGRTFVCKNFHFLQLLASAKARSETLLMRRRIAQTWSSMLACAAARAFAAALLEQCACGGADGVRPPHADVMADFRCAGLGLRVVVLGYIIRATQKGNVTRHRLHTAVVLNRRSRALRFVLGKNESIAH